MQLVNAPVHAWAFRPGETMESNLPFGFRRSAAFAALPPVVDGPPAVKAVAFYLPQYHPIPENDRAWGEGFTEWRNVARGQQEFTDHYQPRIPAAYGFYDLRLAANQVRQAADAARAGLAAFCYYYYWFDGKKPLIAPLLAHRDNADIELPFCLCFANENWTKRWDGLDEEIIFKQSYGDAFADAFWEDVLPFLQSPKYLRDSEGRPILLVYRPSIIPRFSAVADRWRRLARQADLPGLHLIAGMGFDGQRQTKGPDGFYEFPPLGIHAHGEVGRMLPKAVVHGRVPGSQTNAFDYRQWVMMERAFPDSPPDLHPGIMPGWDNVARRPFQGNTFVDVHPRLFEEWALRAAGRASRTREKLLFINAWNEWAEGAHLEPDLRHGWASLAALSRGLEAATAAAEGRATASAASRPVALFVHVHYPEVWEEMSALIAKRMDVPFSLILTTSGEGEPARPSSPLLGRVEVHRVENRGRDILPFITALSRTEIDFDIGLKLHTKRSPHRIDGVEWRRMLVDDLVPKGGCGRFAELFRRDPNIGFLAPDAHWAPIGEHIGSNFGLVSELCRRLGIDFGNRDHDTGRFIAGSMFWFRRAALGMLDRNRIADLFADEAGQLDGTAAHAMERLFGLLGERLGYVTAPVGEVDRLTAQLGAGYPLRARLAMFSDQCVDFALANRIALSRVDNPAPAQDAVVVESASPGARLRVASRLANRPQLYRLYKKLPPEIRRQLRQVLGLPV
jgi:lipopolysaccharide biosynthesis protein